MISLYLTHIIKTWVIGLLAATFGLSLLVAAGTESDVAFPLSLLQKALTFWATLPGTFLAVGFFGSVLSVPLLAMGAGLGWSLRHWSARHPVLAATAACAVTAALTTAVAATMRDNQWAQTHPWPEKFATLLITSETAIYVGPVFFAALFFGIKMPARLLEPDQPPAPPVS